MREPDFILHIQDPHLLAPVSYSPSIMGGLPIVKSTLIINHGLTITFVYKRPNAWWRFCQWLFFGFKWEKL